jgi:NTE family protein
MLVAPDERCAQLMVMTAFAIFPHEKVCNIVQLTYHSKSYEGASKDYEFSRRTMEEHWRSGYDDVVRSLQHPEVLQRPDNPQGVRTFDFCKKERG